MPRLRVDYFGAESGYAVGADNVTLLCVVRNIGNAPLPENTVQLRCLPVNGLDYTSGNLTPLLPGLASNQAIAFRWRLVPLDKDSPLVAALLIENTTAEVAPMAGGSIGSVPPTNTVAPISPTTLLTVIPRFAVPPIENSRSGAAGPAPLAEATAEHATLGNDIVALHVVRSRGRAPILVLTAYEGGAWRSLATTAPLWTIRDGEEGQEPWWESFRWQSTRVNATGEEASLTLVGQLGNRWHGELTLRAHRNTCVLEGHLRLKALRPSRLYSVQLPRLLARLRTPVSTIRADGSPASVTPENDLLAETPNLSAWHEGSSTFGLSWSTRLRPDWHASKLGNGDVGILPVLGGQFDADAANGAWTPPGTILEFSFRLFAFAPSGTVRDAARFTFPPQ